MKNISRRTAIKTVLAGSAAMAVSGMEAAAPAKKKKVEKPEPMKGNIRHSVSKWCFGSYPLDEFCEICKNIGIESIELLDPKDWPIVQKHGLTVAMAQGAGLGIDRGFNDPKLHDEPDLFCRAPERCDRLARLGELRERPETSDADSRKV